MKADLIEVNVKGCAVRSPLLFFWYNSFMKILGIDPGTTRIGFGLIESQGNSLKLLDCGLLKIEAKDKHERLLDLAKSFEELLKKEKPDLVVFEKLFFMKNIKTGLDVAQARGVLLYMTLKNKFEYLEFAPSEVKSFICGIGNADKKMVCKMVCRVLNIDEIVGPDDISDAVAIAICGANTRRF